jgi:hypothetical protein
MPGMGMPGMPGIQTRFRTKASQRKGAEGKEGEEVESGPGFVVSIAGYSPYENLRQLMDPAGVSDDKAKWGVITRLLNLDELVDGNSPFQLYNKTQIEDFKLEIGEVDLAVDMPAGIGKREEVLRKEGTEQVYEIRLIDPMTEEVISKVAERDEYGKERVDSAGKPVYQVKDRWFTLDFKLLWKDAPKAEEEDQVPAE